ncbi:MAG: hypothetical protein ACR2NS_10190 [Gemmatimonadaceae bacterium]
MTGRFDAGGNGAKRKAERDARNAQREAHINPAKALASVLSAWVYTKEDLQSAVCAYVTEMRASGETGEGVVRCAQGLVHEVGARFSSSERTEMLLGDMVTWCLAEYYRESKSESA